MNGGEVGVDCGGPCGKECPEPPPPPVADDDELDRMLLILWIAIAVLLLCLLIMLGVWCTMSSKDEKAAMAALSRPSTKVMPRTAQVTPTGSRTNLLGHNGGDKDAKAGGAGMGVSPRRQRDSTATGTTMTMSELDSRPSDDYYNRRGRRRSSRWTSDSGGVTDRDYATDDALLTPTGRRGSTGSETSYDSRSRGRGRDGYYDSRPTSLATSVISSPRARRRSSAGDSSVGQGGGGAAGAAARGRGHAAAAAAAASVSRQVDTERGDNVGSQQVQPNPHFEGVDFSGNADDLLAQLMADADEAGDGDVEQEPGAFGSAGLLGDDDDLLAGLDGMSDVDPGPPAQMLQQPEFTHSSSRRQLNTAPPMAHRSTPRGRDTSDSAW